jgi:predicted Ser/Thr protein kinase
VLQSAMTEDGVVAYTARTSVTIPIVLMKLMGKSKIRIKKKISQGGFGYVYEGVYDGRKVAVKRLIVPTDRKTKLKWMAMFRMYLPY